jgi:hypothetical protein
VTVFAAFLVVGLLRVAPSLHWPMVYDDLHLVRTFTAEEIAASWRGGWDPDGVETPGFRPGSLLFNHLRARAFGESVAAHRVFLIVLYGAFVALLVPLAGRFGAGPGTVVLAGLLMLAARHEVYGYVWITDGNHMLQGLAFAGGALLLIRGLEGRRWLLAPSLACLAAGLLVREDTVAIVPAVLLLALADRRWRRLDVPAVFFPYAALLALLCVALFAYRAMVVPEAPSPGFDLRGVVVAVARVLNPAGIEAAGPGTRVLMLAGWAAAVVLAAALARWRKDVDWRGPALWLALAVIACAPALNVQRDDLLFFPGTFLALAYAAAAAALAHRGGAARGVAIAAFATLVVASAGIGVVFGENFHPDSTRALWWNMQMLHGDFRQATIPAARRAEVVARLERHGIRAGQHPRERVRQLAAEAKAAGRRRPSASGVPFVPLLPEGF